MLSTAASTSSTPPMSTRAGESEEIVAKALAGGRRDDVVLATKVHGTMGDDPNRRGNSRRWITTECEASLRRLGTDHIDLYQIHRPDPDLRHRRDARRAHRSRPGGQDPLLRELDRSPPTRSSRRSGSRSAAAGSASSPNSRRTRSSRGASRTPSCRSASPTTWGSFPGVRSPGVGSPGPLALAGPTRAAGRHRSRGVTTCRSRRTSGNSRSSPHSVVWPKRPISASSSSRWASCLSTQRSPRRSSGRGHWRSSKRCFSRPSVVLPVDVLDRIDQIVPPGVTFNVADAGWEPPALADASQRRRRRD